jgi:hypothetical protein
VQQAFQPACPEADKKVLHTNKQAAIQIRDAGAGGGEEMAAALVVVFVQRLEEERDAASGSGSWWASPFASARAK